MAGSLDVTDARLPLGKALALVMAVGVYLAPCAVAFYRLDAVEKSQASHLVEARETTAQVRQDIATLDKRQAITEDRYSAILQALGELRATLKERTVYAKGRGE